MTTIVKCNENQMRGVRGVQQLSLLTLFILSLLVLCHVELSISTLGACGIGLSAATLCTKACTFNFAPIDEIDRATIALLTALLVLSIFGTTAVFSQESDLAWSLLSLSCVTLILHHYLWINYKPQPVGFSEV